MRRRAAESSRRRSPAQQVHDADRRKVSDTFCEVLTGDNLLIAAIASRRCTTASIGILAFSFTMLLVEQFAAAALSMADYSYLLEIGRISVHGSGDKLRACPAVKAAHLGGGTSH